MKKYMRKRSFQRTSLKIIRSKNYDAMKIFTKQSLYLSALIALLLVSCRGQPFEYEPIHVVMNMDQQRRYEAQEKNAFFDDQRAMRQPVSGTIARGYLKTNTKYHEGLDADSNYVEKNPLPVTKSFLYDGKKQYEVYCTPCHGQAGAGNGIVMTGDYNYVPAPSFHSDRIRNMPDGQIYSAITNGVRSMPSYAQQIEVQERWAIVSYIRALQLSQNASEKVMADMNVATDTLMESFKKQQAEKQKKKEDQKEKGGGEVSVERGKKLFSKNGCASCHSLDGSSGVGPSMKGIYGEEVTLESGKTLERDEEYLRESIQNPNAKIVQGYQAVMPNVSSGMSDADIQSLVEYIKSIE